MNRYSTSADILKRQKIMSHQHSVQFMKNDAISLFVFATKLRQDQDRPHSSKKNSHRL